MTKSLTRIGQEIKQNLEQFEQLQSKLNQSYQTYMEVLGTALRRQLVLAVYQICTHYYPKAFLALNERDRTHFQQHLQQLGYQALKDLQAALERPYDRNPPPQNLRSGLRKRLPITPEQLRLLKEKLLQKHERLDQNHSSDEEASKDQPIVIALDSEQLQSMLSTDSEVEQSEQENGEHEASDDTNNIDEPTVAPGLPEMMANLATIAHKVREQAESPSNDSNSETSKTSPDEFDEAASEEQSFEPPCNPSESLHWVQNVEQFIQETLSFLSLQANRTLHQSAILPTQLPSKLFAAAIEADEGSSSNPTMLPNTMNLVVETDFSSETDTDDSSIVSITAVRLRLAEVEIAENTVAVARSQLRERLAKMKTLARQYQKLQKEQATAQAEAAWRTTWYEALPTDADTI
ncbi:MAG: hypothetical protein F6J87_19920 [Spirulina sp. SIO3F2]|nr:hypothetical protein [Spirulina sp. SIO3F2]